MMRIKIIKGDITKLSVDAIVNAANPSLMGGGGVDGAIHHAAGPQLLRECEIIRKKQYPNGLPTGQAVMTKVYNLPARHVIHTVGPIYGVDDIALLPECYKNSLIIAEKNNLRTIAFPSISTGVYGVPIIYAVKMVKDILTNYRSKIIEEVTLVLHSDNDFLLYKRSFK